MATSNKALIPQPHGGAISPFDGKRNKGGRPKGVPNKMTRMLREAIVDAAEAVGEDNKGKGGLMGYLKRLAINHPESYASLMGRIIPLQVQARVEAEVRDVTEGDDVRRELRTRGLPDTLFDIDQPARMRVVGGGRG